MTLLAALALALAPWQDKPRDEFIQMKDGTNFVGKILSVNATGVEMTLQDGAQVRLEFAGMLPYSVYKIKSDRLDPKDAKGRWELGEFALAQQLFSIASLEFDKAAGIDPSMAERAKKRKEDVLNEEARFRFEEAKKLGQQKKYAEALKHLDVITEKMKATPYFEEAEREKAKLAEELKRENDAREAALQKRKADKEAAAAKSVEDAEKNQLTLAEGALDEARKLWAEGLDHETKPNTTKADKAWKLADAKIGAARGVTERLSRSNDVEMIKRAKDLDRELDAWTIRICYRLGRLWAVELNYTEALEWLNKGLKLSPDDHLINEVLLTLSQVRMRQQAAAKGY